MTRRELLAGAAASTVRGRPRRLLVAGQSLALMWRETEVQAAFRSTAGEDWQVTVAAQGGTAALPSREHHWLNLDGSPGPVLKTMLMAVEGQAFDALYWVQGQADADDYGTLGFPRAEFARCYVAAVEVIKARLAPGVPAWLQMIGWRADRPKLVGWETVRFAQTRIHARGRLQIGAVQSPWCELRDAVHPTVEEAANMASDFGRKLQ